MTPYAQLIRCAEQLRNLKELASITDEDIASADWILESNDDILVFVAELLQQRIEVPCRFEAGFLDTLCNDSNLLQNLSRVLRAKALVAVESSDYETAIRACLQLLELAAVLRRGGLIFGALTGNGFIGQAIECLRKIRKLLTTEVASALITELSRWEADVEDFDAIIDLDNRWTAAVKLPDIPVDPSSFILPEEECGLDVDSQQELFRLTGELGKAAEAENYQPYRNQDFVFLALSRLLQIELTLAVFVEIHDRLPKDLDELQEYHPLQSLPLDPFSDQPFVFHRFGKHGYWLYSLGPKRISGGGRFGSMLEVSLGQADLCLDMRDFEED